jgi:hypothetical protein
VSGSRAHAQPSASPDPAKGRQDAPSVVHSSQPHRSRNHTLAVVLAMTQYPLLPGTSEYGAWRAELHAHLEFATLHHNSARARSRCSRDLGAGPSALRPSFLRACHTPLLSLAPGAALKSWGLTGRGGMAGVSAQPWGPWGLEPQDPWIWTAHRLGCLVTPRVGAWTTVAATLLWPMKLSSERTCSSCDRKSRAQLSPTRKAQLRREPLLWSTGWMPRLHPCPPAGGLAIQVLSPRPRQVQR